MLFRSPGTGPRPENTDPTARTEVCVRFLTSPKSFPTMGSYQSANLSIGKTTLFRPGYLVRGTGRERGGGGGKRRSERTSKTLKTPSLGSLKSTFLNPSTLPIDGIRLYENSGNTPNSFSPKETPDPDSVCPKVCGSGANRGEHWKGKKKLFV